MDGEKQPLSSAESSFDGMLSSQTNLRRCCMAVLRLSKEWLLLPVTVFSGATSLLILRRKGAVWFIPDSTFSALDFHGNGKTDSYSSWNVSLAGPKALAALAFSALRSSIASFRTSSFTFISRMVLERSFSSSFMEM